MAAPLSGLGQSQQQLPISQTYQPGGNDQVRQSRQEEQQSRENEIQSRNSETNQTQRSETQNTDTVRASEQRESQLARAENNSLSASSQDPDPNSPRGSLVNITV